MPLGEVDSLWFKPCAVFESLHDNMLMSSTAIGHLLWQVLFDKAK